jgi:hypothetical protein
MGEILQYLFVTIKTSFFAILGTRILIFQVVPIIGLLLQADLDRWFSSVLQGHR